MRDAEITAQAGGLVGDEIADIGATDTGLPVSIQVRNLPGLAHLGGGDGGDGATEGVSRDHEPETWVGRRGGCECRENATAGFHPGGVEARVDGAGGAEVRGRGGGEIGVGEEVADGFGAAEGEDGEAAGGVGGEVAGHVGEEGVLEFVEGGGGVGLDERAVRGRLAIIGRACQFLAAGAVVGVGGAVCRCGELLEELEVGEGGVVDCWFRGSALLFPNFVLVWRRPARSTYLLDGWDL